MKKLDKNKFRNELKLRRETMRILTVFELQRVPGGNFEPTETESDTCSRGMGGVRVGGLLRAERAPQRAEARREAVSTK
jgi:hypothetical protein